MDAIKPMQPASATQTVYNGGLKPLTAAHFTERAAAQRQLLESEAGLSFQARLPATYSVLLRALDRAEALASQGFMSRAEKALDVNLAALQRGIDFATTR